LAGATFDEDSEDENKEDPLQDELGSYSNSSTYISPVSPMFRLNKSGFYLCLTEMLPTFFLCFTMLLNIHMLSILRRGHARGRRDELPLLYAGDVCVRGGHESPRA
jgi:hypothetical protein